MIMYGTSNLCVLFAGSSERNVSVAWLALFVHHKLCIRPTQQKHENQISQLKSDTKSTGKCDFITTLLQHCHVGCSLHDC